MATFLEKSDTFTDWMEKINKFHEEIQNGFGIPSQENKYDTTDGKYLQVGAFGLGEISTTTTDTLDVTGTRFDFVSADATSNFSMPRNFLGGSLVTIVNNGQGFQIIQNDDDLNFRTVYNDVYEEWISFKNILDNVSFGITKESVTQEDYLYGVASDDLVPMAVGGGTLTETMNAQIQALLNQIEMLKQISYPVTKETLFQDGVLTVEQNGSIEVPKAENGGTISDLMNAQAQALLNMISTMGNSVDVINVSSIDELKSTVFSENVKYINVLSYHVGLNKGGGWFIVDRNDTSTVEDGGSIFSGQNGYRLKRIFSTSLSLYDFGAKGDGVTDDSDAFRKAMKYGEFNIPRGTFILNGTFNTEVEHVVIRGNGGLLKPFVASGTYSFIRGVETSTKTLTMYDVRIDGSRGTGKLDDPQGMYLVAGAVSEKFTAISCELTNNYGSGFNCASKGTSTIISNRIINVSGYNSTRDTSGARDNYGDGIRVSQGKTAIVSGNVITNTNYATRGLGRAGIVVEFYGDNALLQGNFIRGYDRGIHVEFGDGAIIQSNNIDKCGTCVITVNALNAVVQGNILKATEDYSTGIGGSQYLFSNYGVIYDYLGNSMTIVDNYIETTVSNVRALLSNGNKRDKFTLERNVIKGRIELAGGSSSSNIRNNIFTNPETVTHAITGTHNIENNVFTRCKVTGIKGGYVKYNQFDNFSEAPLELINTSNLKVLNNTFILTPNYAGYVINNFGGRPNDGNELGGNVVNTAASVVHNRPTLLRYNASTYLVHDVPVLNTYYDGFIHTGIELGETSGTSRFNQSEVINTLTNPSTGRWYQKGARLHYVGDDTTPLVAKVCTTTGFATERAWTESTAVTVGTVFYSGLRTYIVIKAGTTGATAPTSVTLNIVIADGTAELHYLGAKATFVDWYASTSPIVTTP